MAMPNAGTRREKLCFVAFVFWRGRDRGLRAGAGPHPRAPDEIDAPTPQLSGCLACRRYRERQRASVGDTTVHRR